MQLALDDYEKMGAFSETVTPLGSEKITRAILGVNEENLYHLDDRIDFFKSAFPSRKISRST